MESTTYVKQRGAAVYSPDGGFKLVSEKGKYSKRKVESCQANGKKSKGPTSETGKKISSRNAINAR